MRTLQQNDFGNSGVLTTLLPSMKVKVIKTGINLYSLVVSIFIQRLPGRKNPLRRVRTQVNVKGTLSFRY